MQVPLYNCVKAPCGGYGVANRVNTNRFGVPATGINVNLPFGFGSVAFNQPAPLAGAPEFGVLGPTGFSPPTWEPPDERRVPVPTAIEPPRAHSGISEAEHAEIDQKIEEQAATAAQIALLGEYVDTIHPDRLVAIGSALAAGERQGPPPPPQTADVIPLPVQTHPIGAPGPFMPDIVAAPRPPEPRIPDSPPGEDMNLSAVLAGAAGLVSAAGAYRAAGQTPTAPWPVNPAPQIYGASVQPAAMIPAVVGGAGRALATVAPRINAAKWAKAAAVAAATGLGLEAVLAIWDEKPTRRRRRRMLTQSDFADIAKMNGLLGNGKAFTTWLAANGMARR